MSKESNQHTFLPSYRIIDAIFNRLNIRLSEKGGLDKHSYLKYALAKILKLQKALKILSIL